MKFLAKHSYIVVFLMVFFVSFILDKFFKIESIAVRFGIAAFIAILISPRKRKIQTQTGERTQITWFLLKEPMFLD